MKTAGSTTGGRATADVGLWSREPVIVTQSVAPSTLKQRLIAADAVVVAIGLAMAFAWQSFMRADQDLGVQRPHLMLAFVTFPVWTISFSLNKLYQARAVERPTEEIRRIINASLVSVGVILGGRLRRTVQGAVATVDPVGARVRAAAAGPRAD